MRVLAGPVYSLARNEIWSQCTLYVSYDRQEMQKSHPLVNLLQETTIASLLHTSKSFQLHSVSQNAHLDEAIQLLADKEVLSLPVKLEEHSVDYVGFIDVLDVLFFIIQTCSEGANLEEAQWR